MSAPTVQPPSDNSPAIEVVGVEGVGQASMKAALDAVGQPYTVNPRLVRGMAAKVYEAGIQQRVVVIEFDTLAQALAAHDTPAYQAALKELDGGAVERDLRIVEGVA